MIYIKEKSGGRRIRTFEAEATDLQSVPFDRSGTPPAFLGCSLLNSTNMQIFIIKLA